MFIFTMIWIVVLSLLMASSSALPQSYDHQSGQVIPILRDERTGPIDGVYSFDFETGDGISRHEQGNPSGPEGAVVSQGAWSFTFPDGTPGEFSFVADENGYRVESPLLPQPPPLPQHAIEQIEKAERERAAGIIHDGQYTPEDHQQPTRREQQQQYNK